MEVVEVYNGGEDSDFELDENILKELYKADSANNKATTSSIKDDLRIKIQQRRISEGQGELKIQFEPPKPYEVPYLMLLIIFIFALTTQMSVIRDGIDKASRLI